MGIRRQVACRAKVPKGLSKSPKVSLRRNRNVNVGQGEPLLDSGSGFVRHHRVLQNASMRADPDESQDGNPGQTDPLTPRKHLVPPFPSLVVAG